jgi:hypothetical protein
MATVSPRSKRAWVQRQLDRARPPRRPQVSNRRPRCRPARKVREGQAAPCRSTGSRGRFESLQPRHGGHRRLSRRRRKIRFIPIRWLRLGSTAAIDEAAFALAYASPAVRKLARESGVDLEEGFITFTSLPGGLLTKVGKMRAAFGKVNSLHNHVLPWADRPLVINNLVGGEDGISDAGISVARLIPNPWLFLEATGQVFRGDSGPDEQPLYRASERSDLSYVGHLRAYQDINENSNLDFGGSFSQGHNGLSNGNQIDPGTLTTQLWGLDATYRWKPLQRSIYHSFVGRTEWIWSGASAERSRAAWACMPRATISSGAAGSPVRADRSIVPTMRRCSIRADRSS